MILVDSRRKHNPFLNQDDSQWLMCSRGGLFVAIGPTWSELISIVEDISQYMSGTGTSGQKEEYSGF